MRSIFASRKKKRATWKFSLLHRSCPASLWWNKRRETGGRPKTEEKKTENREPKRRGGEERNSHEDRKG